MRHPSKLPSRVLAATALISLAAVASALVAQHGFDVRPCPWCVLQRGVFLLMALVAGLGWLAQGYFGLRKASLLMVAVLGMAGLAAALYQHNVAAQLATCDLTLADRILTTLALESLWPKVFMVTASCAQAGAYKLLGLPYEAWSGLLFGLSSVASVLALRSR